MKVKKFMCTLCKYPGRPSHFSKDCQKLKKLSAEERERHLKENLDCRRCVGDHRPGAAECNLEMNLCGGGKRGKGCGKQMEDHEFFCPDVKALVIPQVEVMFSKGNQKKGVFLHVMWVRDVGGRTWSRGFFDPGASGNFVSHAFARRKGFRGSKVQVNVEVLGGKCELKQTMLYECFLTDRDGVKETFWAYGVDKVVSRFGEVSEELIRKWFPNLSRKDREELINRTRRRSPGWR